MKGAAHKRVTLIVTTSSRCSLLPSSSGKEQRDVYAGCFRCYDHLLSNCCARNPDWFTPLRKSAGVAACRTLNG